MSYLAFVLQERKVLSFGLSFTFFSSFGQTFLISLFVPFFLEDFNLTNAAFGSIYSGATLASAAILPYLGKWIDVLPIGRYSLYVACGLLIASLTMAFSWHIGFLFAAILMLRLSGQGLSGHTAETAMARYFNLQRGKALSVSSLGYPLGEGLLPVAMAAILAVFSWRVTWGIIAAVIALVFIPYILYLLKKTAIEEKNQVVKKTEDTGEESEDKKGSYSMMFGDRRFWLILPAVLLPPFWATGLFLYQVSIAEQLGWTAAIIASAFIFFAGARIVSSLGIGPVIDRFSARQIFPFYILPLGAGVLMGVFHPGIWSAFVYMALIGVTMGFGNATKSALWAELYGEDMIGTVRSLFASLMVFSTALSPFLMGWMLDNGVAIESILFSAFLTVVAGAFLAFLGLRNADTETA
ncbi:MFS transporter [Gracilimonas mengyeensis]|uniref:Predicted arabinose efflux permease, MFS family n=1 Tax=Gracilimonas mengyeensis TaxID=1302730 RepID=A0A521CG05_9BACT|nr:MFS transporter [Gracilimonas mengyeensis]SMO58358.1 Predicted arabinose efflux permease, MFS family [Gracilimonas mengyeensis]